MPAGPWLTRFLKGMTFLVYFYLLAPVLVVIALAFNPRDLGDFPFEEVSLKWFYMLANDQAILNSVRISFTLGLMSAAITTTLGTAAAYALARYRVFGKDVVQLVLLIPMLVPHLILGVGLLLAWRLMGLPKTFALLVVGHVAVTMPLVIIMTRHRLQSISKSYEEAARTLGANGLQTFTSITLPLAAPAIIVAFLFAFMSSFDELTATLFWRPANVETVPTQIMAMLQYQIDHRINALATVLICFTVGVPVLATLVTKGLTTTLPRMRAKRLAARLAASENAGGNAGSLGKGRGVV